MDSPTERMPIACVHCAKAKAKCDKKVSGITCMEPQNIHRRRSETQDAETCTLVRDLPHRTARLPCVSVHSKDSHLEHQLTLEVHRFHAQDV